ncbi:MAG: hypothetical protein OXC14_14095 [Rhodospirillaceae bacterium]|nr:hypothetical protein [Rhodospirillaceae bacterium]
MRWPWSREQRQAADTTSSTAYTDARIAAILAAAGGDAAADVNAIAAAEVASGLWGRAFASASVEPLTSATVALTPAVLELIGRELVRKGEALFEIAVMGGEARLVPVSWWDVYGDHQPESWEYQITLAGPDRTSTRRVRAERVVHVRYATTPTEPWRGVSPLAHSRTTSDLAAMLETRLSQEASAAVGAFVPVPTDGGAGGEDDPLAVLKGDISAAKGRTVLVETTSSGWSEGRQAAPARDWESKRFGANPPAVLDALRSNSARHVLAACGVPIELVEPAEGSGAREAFRRFLHATISPVAALVRDELRHKLDTPDLVLGFDGLFAADVQGRARAWRSLAGQEASLDPQTAARLVGLSDDG